MSFSDDPQPEKLPSVFKQFVATYAELGEAHQKIGKAVESYGPLDRKTIELVKIGISIGAGLETATRATNGSSARTTAQQFVVASMTTWSSGCKRFWPM